MSAPGPRRATVPTQAQTEWRTPPWLFGLLDEEFAFTLDAAADHANHLCSTYYTIEDDAFAQTPSDETIYCNPPYGRLGPWIEAFGTWAKYRHCTVVALLPAATETVWFRTAWRGASEIRFIHKRVRFLRPDGSPGGSPTGGSVVIVWRPGVMAGPWVPPRVVLWEVGE